MIVGILLVRNEADIIRECLEHHMSEGIDAFIVTDHKSTDETRQIVTGFKEVVELIDETNDVYLHGHFMTRMARRAYELGADWVVPIDGDEFWYGVRTLPDDKSIGYVKIPRICNHPPTRQAQYEGFLRSQMPYYRSIDRIGMFGSENPTGRFAFRPTPNVGVTDGNHLVVDGQGRSMISADLGMHHYSIRSFRQFEQKIINGVAALRNHPDAAVAVHWKRWYATGNLREVYDSMLVDENSGLEKLS